jgi:hypothetical protein
VKPWLITCAFSAAALCAQDQAPTLNDAEKKFQATMENVTLVGYYTFGDSADLKADQYRVEHITKVKEDTWNFEARFKLPGYGSAFAARRFDSSTSQRRHRSFGNAFASADKGVRPSWRAACDTRG